MDRALSVDLFIKKNSGSLSASRLHNMAKKSDKKSFIIMKDLLDPVTLMTDEEAGKMLRAMIDYWNEKEINLSRELSFAFASIKNQFDRDWDKYQKTSEMNKKNGSLGGKRKSSNRYLPVATGSDRKRNVAILADTDTDTDTDNEKNDHCVSFPQSQPKK